MAIASGGTLGTGVSSTGAASYTLTTATNTLAAGDFALLVSVTDNTATADGASNEHTSVTGGTGSWFKLGEYTNSPGGVAADGVTTSLWLFVASGSVAVGTVITMNLAASCTDKAASFWKFTKAAGKDVILQSGTTNPITSEVTASNGFGSSAFSGLSSASRLYFRALGKEANSTTGITVSTSFTAITANRSRNNASAVLVRGEFRINTSTGETSNPTLAVSGDTAGLFAALIEADPLTATLTVTEADDALSATAVATQTTVDVSWLQVVDNPIASLSVTEANDALASASTANLVGTLAATEANDALASAALAVGTAALTRTEANDTLASELAGAGSLVAVLTEGNDTTSATAAAELAAALSVAEANDTLASTATGPAAVTVQVSWLIVDSSAITATLAVTEANDALAATATANAITTVQVSWLLVEPASGQTLQATITEQADTLAAVLLTGSDPAVTGSYTPAMRTRWWMLDEPPNAVRVVYTEQSDAIQSSASAAGVATALIVEAGDTLTASMAVPLTASLSVTEQNDSLTAAASVEAGRTITADIQELNDSLSATLVAPGPAIANAAIAEEADTCAASAAAVAAVAAVIAEAQDTVAAFARTMAELFATLNASEQNDTLAATVLAPIAPTVSLTATEAGDSLLANLLIGSFPEFQQDGRQRIGQAAVGGSARIGDATLAGGARVGAPEL